jgi:hypothetical protein
MGLSLAVLSVRSQETNDVPQPTTITVDGVTYEDVRWGTVTPSAVSIFHKTGIASIPLEKLPPELQQQFGYDPNKAAEYRAAEADALAKKRAAQQAQTGDLAQPNQSQPGEGLKGTVGYLDARNGFRDLKFGQSISQCPGMRLVKTDYRGISGQNVKTYVRASDVLRIGTAQLDSILYIFYKDKLMAVQITAKSDDDMRVIMGAFAELYGEGKVGSWEGEKVNAHGFVGGLEISSKELEAQMEEDENVEQKAKAKEAAREGADGF